jgi:hypothetical protein
VRDFARDDSAWADFLISKAALILASVILFAALFDLVAGFKELEAQEQLDFLARDFKTAVDEVGSNNSGSGNFLTGAQQDFQGEFHKFFYCFEEKEIFRDSPFAGDMKARVSGEYVCLEARSGERSFRAVRPFAFRVLPFNESVLHEKLLAEFGARGSEEAPLKAGYPEIVAFIQALGTEEAVLDPGEKILLKKELIYVKDGEGVSAFVCVLVYQ